MTLYWPEAELVPAGRRELGFSYGLGSLATADESGRLALLVGRCLRVRRRVDPACLRPDAVGGETLTLEGPAGWGLLAGQPMAPVPAPDAAASRPISLVSWKVRTATGAAKGRLRVRSSTGLSREIDVTLQTGR